MNDATGAHRSAGRAAHPGASPARLSSALRFRGFRLFWLALIAQVCGQMMFQFTLGWLAFDLTGSPASLGLVHLCGFAPQIVVTLAGGVLADRWDPRRLIGFAQTLGAVMMFALGVVTLLGLVQLWHLALAAFLLGVSTSIDEPSRSAFFPRLFPDRTQLRAAVPLISMAWGGTRIVAPSVAGFLVAASGAHAGFFASAAAVCAMVCAVFVVRPVSAGPAPSHGSLLHNFMDSVRYVRRNEVFARVILAALLNATLVMGHIHMLPVIAKDVLGVDARGLGVLASAGGVGSLAGLLSYPRIQARFAPGRFLVWCVACVNLALLGVAASTSFRLTVLLLAAAGFAHSWYMTGTQVILQTLVDDRYRGRVMALFSLVWSLFVFSGFLLNSVAELTGPRIALALGACAMLAFTTLSLARSTALKRVSLAHESQG